MATHAPSFPADRSGGLRQVTIEMWHSGCWGLELNNQFPRLHIVEKSTYQSENHIKGDLVFIVDNPSEMDELLKRAREHKSVYNLAVLKKTSDRARVLAEYDKSYSVLPTVTNSDLMAVEPFHIANGSKYWTFVTEADTISKQVDLLEEKFEVRIKSIQDFSEPENVEYADVIDEIYSELSTRQQEALFLAADKGYYQWPREVSAGEIADVMGVSGPTFLEHLRQGEHKLINKLLECIQRRHQNKLLPSPESAGDR